VTRDQAVEWFWKTCPPGCLIELFVLRPIPTDQGPIRGFAYVGDDPARDLVDFLDECATVAGEPWSGSTDRDSELVEFVRGAVLSAYGRADACRVTVQR
jgi:hypothetical protein